MNINRILLTMPALFVFFFLKNAWADESAKQEAKSIITKQIIPQDISSSLKNYNLTNAETLPVSTELLNKTLTTTAPQENKQKIGGYILNKQLVNQIARPFPDFGVVIGQGWNSFLNRQSANTCIEGATETLLGTQLNSSVTSVQDQASYYEAISANVGASYGPFSGSGGYSKEKNFSYYDANVVMNVVVDTGGVFIKPSTDKGIQLSSYALSLLNSKDGADGVSRFLHACGDSFVTTIRSGGRMTAFLNISNISNRQKEEIKSQASGGIGALSANANFRKQIEAATSGNKLTVSFEQVGGAFNGSPVSLQDFLDKFSQYNVGQTYNPRPYVFYTMNYRTLPNWPIGKDNLVSPVDQDYYVLSYYNFMQLVSDYDRYLLKTESYKNFLLDGDSELNLLRDLALTYARVLDLTIWECVSNFNCSTTAINEIDGIIKQESDAIKQEKLGGASTAQGSAILNDATITTYVTIGNDNNSIIDSSKKNSDPKDDARDNNTINFERNTYISKMTLDYYRLLASLPLIKINEGIEFQPPLKSPGGIDNDIVVFKAFRDWLISARIRPTSNRYCQIAASHPLCLSSKKMNDIASLINVRLDAIRTVDKSNPPVVVPPPPTVKSAGPRRSNDPCERSPRLCHLMQ